MEKLRNSATLSSDQEALLLAQVFAQWVGRCRGGSPVHTRRSCALREQILLTHSSSLEQAAVFGFFATHVAEPSGPGTREILAARHLGAAGLALGGPSTQFAPLQ